MGNPEVAWFKSRSRYFSNNKAYKFKIVYNLIIGRIVGINPLVQKNEFDQKQISPGRIVGINIPLVQKNEFDQKQISPGRIMVLHQIANLDPSGCAGSIPAQGVLYEKRGVNQKFRKS